MRSNDFKEPCYLSCDKSTYPARVCLLPLLVATAAHASNMVHFRSLAKVGAVGGAIPALYFDKRKNNSKLGLDKMPNI